MAFWDTIHWVDAPKRKEQLDEYIDHTGVAAFGRKKVSAAEKVNTVAKHFNRVAPKYDLMNSILSMGLQHVWKRAAVRMMNIRAGDRIIDVCGGTGDLAVLAARQTGPSGFVTIYDFNRAMMNAGQDKIRSKTIAPITCIQGDAEFIAFPDNTFDGAMVGFGIRNVTHLKKGFSEMHRVLRPGGKIMCLDFSKPTNTFFRGLYDFYSFNVMPFLGGLIVGSAQSYACLSETIRMFPLPDELSRILETIGFEKVEYKRMTNGIAVVHIGVKAGSG